MVTSVQAQTAQTFKHTRVVNSHSVDLLQQGNLDVLIRHRFGPLESGALQFWGLDQAITRMALEYAPRDFINVGLGRTSGGFFDAFLKVRVLQQEADKSPLSLAAVSSMGFDHLSYDQFPDESDFSPFLGSLSYFHQILIGSEVHERLALQLMPSYLHMNWREAPNLSNDVLSMGAGMGLRINKHHTVILEYVQNLTPAASINRDGDYEPVLSLGWNIETAGHVFALHFSNTPGLVGQQYMRRSTGSPWDPLNYGFGFNLSRNFRLHK